MIMNIRTELMNINKTCDLFFPPVFSSMNILSICSQKVITVNCVLDLLIAFQPQFKNSKQIHPAEWH